MRPLRVGLVSLGLIALVAAALVDFGEAESEHSAPTGVRFHLPAKQRFEPFVKSSTPAQQRWMRDAYARVRAHPPFYDPALEWSPPAYVYKNLYAIYPSEDQRLLRRHPEWVLRDRDGEPLYIPYGCAEGRCPQYAADVGSPAWRSHWIASVRRELEKGYVGVHIDDVNLQLHVGDGSGSPVRPLDPRTGRRMRPRDWRRYVVEFVEQVRGELPDAFISHNPVWWLDEADPMVQREVAAADAIEIERSFEDPNLTATTHAALLEHVDWLHAQGKEVILQPYGLTSLAERESALASYFLVREGQDAIISAVASFPDNWWPGWEADLGSPEGERYVWNGLLRRDFEDGFVLVNPPEQAPRTVELDDPGARLDGTLTDTLTLDERKGVVMLDD